MLAVSVALRSMKGGALRLYAYENQNCIEEIEEMNDELCAKGS